ncbi:hypothetical protein O6H91_22G067800 [Diphasiastrum complanatum]|uniref:Uncharacterized protein n=1 Tax=Diphasiastrum complanatum TaxID=34168 RepID=A0ACC2AGH7_DIPCM|nr:hypothetical protein O6H91_22G067800 [Diphasiastrum complanatum]
MKFLIDYLEELLILIRIKQAPVSYILRCAAGPRFSGGSDHTCTVTKLNYAFLEHLLLMIARKMELSWSRRNIATTVINFCLIIVPAVTFASFNPATSIASNTQPDPTPFPFCNYSEIFQSNSSFEKNLNILLDKLVASTSPSEGMEALIEGTNSTETVYAYRKCLLTSLTQNDCNQCLKRAAYQIRKLCPNVKRASILNDECSLGYIVRLQNARSGLATSYGPHFQIFNKVWSKLRQEAALTANPVALTYGEPPDSVFGYAQCHNLWKEDCLARFDSIFQYAVNTLHSRAVFTDAFVRCENGNFYTDGVLPYEIIVDQHHLQLQALNMKKDMLQLLLSWEQSLEALHC